MKEEVLAKETLEEETFTEEVYQAYQDVYGPLSREEAEAFQEYDFEMNGYDITGEWAPDVPDWVRDGDQYRGYEQYAPQGYYEDNEIKIDPEEEIGVAELAIEWLKDGSERAPDAAFQMASALKNVGLEFLSQHVDVKKFYEDVGRVLAQNEIDGRLGLKDMDDVCRYADAVLEELRPKGCEKWVEEQVKSGLEAGIKENPVIAMKMGYNMKPMDGPEEKSEEQNYDYKDIGDR